ncbi:hypothetical protein HGRIS_013572 [Hohenbuehelia grisea]|uniref:JmjC domain-containing protein n=1 Tax=Hohenbuehelia grisea TaxID=104357 RepID=A0ABR3IVY2_9AGAR
MDMPLLDWKVELIRDIAAELGSDDASFGRGGEPLADAARELSTIAGDLTRHEIAPDQSCITKVEALIQRAYEGMAASFDSAALTGWRRIFTDASIVIALVNSALSPVTAIGRLDRAIIIAGAAGPSRLELVQHLITKIQNECAVRPTFSITPSPDPLHTISEVTLASARRQIPVLSTPPSLMPFQNKYSRAPFILRGFATDWPAMNEHPWSSAEYLRRVAGPGRVVPVEVGQDYRSDEWSQKLMDWDDFLASIDLSDACPASTTKDVLYLAQHNLMMQFPALRDDICVPDYVYASLSDADFPGYKPPGNDDQLVINAWLGPLGTLSPAHTDPYHNFYVQVVGEKTVWLAPAESLPSMYPYPPRKSAASPADSNDTCMANTSRMDVFTDDKEGSLKEFPAFWQNVYPNAMYATLHPGDMLFFPAGWWHAMRSESVSFSVSMWF